MKMNLARSISLLFSVWLATTSLIAEPSPLPKPVLSWAELSRMPLPAPGEVILYGDGPQQLGELRLPKGEGPFPVMILIHGGCWQNEFDYVYITRLAAWFADHGLGSWTIEYRRLGDKESGWPGTFLDVAKAADFLLEISKTHPIDLRRVFASGHSAGGQLALWLASRAKLSTQSDLYVKNPITIRGVLGLAAITDLAKYRIGPPGSCHSSVEPLLGGAPEKVPARYAETSPLQLLPLGLPQVFIQGRRDSIVDPGSVNSYVEAATKAGDRAVVLPLPSAGHFETSVPLPEMEPLLHEALRLLRE